MDSIFAVVCIIFFFVLLSISYSLGKQIGVRVVVKNVCESYFEERRDIRYCIENKGVKQLN